MITNLLLISMAVPILDIPYKWNYTLRSFYVWPLALSIMFLRFIYVVASINTLFLCVTE